MSLIGVACRLTGWAAASQASECCPAEPGFSVWMRGAGTPASALQHSAVPTAALFPGALPKWLVTIAYECQAAVRLINCGCHYGYNSAVPAQACTVNAAWMSPPEQCLQVANEVHFAREAASDATQLSC